MMVSCHHYNYKKQTIIQLVIAFLLSSVIVNFRYLLFEGWDHSLVIHLKENMNVLECPHIVSIT